MWVDRKKGRVGRHGVEFRKRERHKSEVRNKRETKIRPSSQDEKKEKSNETFSKEKDNLEKEILRISLTLTRASKNIRERSQMLTKNN